MKYIKIDWIHTFDDDPHLYLLEVADDGSETKRIEKYKNGRVCYASDTIEVGTYLSPLKFDNIAELQFESDNEKIVATCISKEEFIKEWEKLTI